MEPSDLDHLAALKYELARRAEARAEALKYPRPTFMDDLYPQQREIFECEVKDRAWLAGRRYGKSIGVSRWLLDGCFEAPGSDQLYTSKTRLHAKEVLWQPLLDALRDHGFTRCGPGRKPENPREYKEDNAELTLTFYNKSSIHLGGMKDRSEVDKFRGKSFFRVAIDECGAVAPGVLAYAAEEVLEPASVDWNGETIYLGTPGPLPFGYWFEMTGPRRTMEIPLFRGTMFDNPHLPHARDVADKVKERHGWDDDHPTWVREWLGRWVFDTAASVFPWTPDDEIDELPKAHKSGWTVVLAIDVGQVNANGYCMWASHANLPDDYVLKSWKVPGQLIDEMAEDIRVGFTWVRDLIGDDDLHVAVVLDTGGMGKQHAEELRRRKSIPVHAAEKREKRSAMIVLGDRIRSHRVKVLAGEQNDALRDDWAVSQWNEKRTDFEEDSKDETSHRDVSHASLYGHRRLRNYLYEPEEVQPEPGTQEWARAEEKKMEAQQRKRYQRPQHRGPSWDR